MVDSDDGSLWNRRGPSFDTIISFRGASCGGSWDVCDEGRGKTPVPAFGLAGRDLDARAQGSAPEEPLVTSAGSPEVPLRRAAPRNSLARGQSARGAAREVGAPSG